MSELKCKTSQVRGMLQHHDTMFRKVAQDWLAMHARIAGLEAENAELRADNKSHLAALDGACEENIKLRAVVERLPKTADGVPMMVDDETWVRHLDGDEPQRARVIAIHNVGGKMLVDVDELHASNDHYSLTTLLRLALPSKCFSTREAALAAQGRATVKGAAQTP